LGLVNFGPCSSLGQQLVLPEEFPRVEQPSGGGAGRSVSIPQHGVDHAHLTLRGHFHELIPLLDHGRGAQVERAPATAPVQVALRALRELPGQFECALPDDQHVVGFLPLLEN